MTQEEFKNLRLMDTVYLNGRGITVQDIDRREQKVMFGFSKWKDFRVIATNKADSFRAYEESRKHKFTKKTDTRSFPQKIKAMKLFEGTFKEFSKLTEVQVKGMTVMCSLMRKKGTLHTEYLGKRRYRFKYIEQ